MEADDWPPLSHYIVAPPHRPLQDVTADNRGFTERRKKTVRFDHQEGRQGSQGSQDSHRDSGIDTSSTFTSSEDSTRGDFPKVHNQKKKHVEDARALYVERRPPHLGGGGIFVTCLFCLSHFNTFACCYCLVIQFDFAVCARTLLRSAFGVLVANVISGTIFGFFHCDLGFNSTPINGKCPRMVPKCWGI